MPKIVAEYRDHDARVYVDDSIELFVNPHACQNDTYFWFATNSLGTRAEGKGIQAGTMLDRTWDAGKRLRGRCILYPASARYTGET